MIKGEKFIILKQILDKKGKIMHIMKFNHDNLKKIWEIFFSWAWPGSIKYWHIYQSMNINNAVISGNAKLMMYYLRKESSTYL